MKSFVSFSRKNPTNAIAVEDPVVQKVFEYFQHLQIMYYGLLNGSHSESWSNLPLWKKLIMFLLFTA